jgi:hypothetical protein
VSLARENLVALLDLVVDTTTNINRYYDTDCCRLGIA